MPKEKQTRKQWIAKLRRDAVGPYFKVNVFFLFFVCLFVVVVVVFLTPFLAWLSCLLSARFNTYFVIYNYI